MVEIIPKFDKVVIERQKFTSSKGGLIIPEEAQKKYSEAKGIIIALGPDVCRDANLTEGQLEIGMKVMFGRFAGDWIELEDDREIYVCLDTDIIAEIKE